MLRIVYFVEMMTEDFDGVSVTIHEIARRLPKDKIQAIFISPQPPDNDIGFPVYQCPYINIPVSNKGYRFGMPNRMKELRGILDDFKPHILHFSSPSSTANYAAKYAKEKNILLTSIFHTHFQSYAPYYLWFFPYAERILNPLAKYLLRAYRACDMVLAPTPTIKNYLSTMDFVPEKVKVWGRGVNSSKYHPRNRTEDFYPNLPKDTKKVLFVSRLVGEKEIDTLLRLYKVMDERRQDIKLIIVGEGPEEKRMRRKMPNALFMGKQTGERLAKAYASADLFVFPSVTETFGNVILEAMASGLPVVAAAGGGPIDIIQTGKNGVLVTPKKEEEFFKEIVKIVDNKEYHDELRRGAIDYARAQRWDDLVKQLVKHYHDLAGIPLDADSSGDVTGDQGKVIRQETIPLN